MARPSPFAWDYTRTSGMVYTTNKITATEWIRLQTNINDVRAYVGLSAYAFTTPVAGNDFTAALWNEAIDALDDMSAYYTETCPSTHVAGDRVMASYFEAIKDCLNSVSMSFAQFSFKTNNTSTGSSGSTSVRLPLTSGGTYNFIVDWGDGNTDTITVWNQAERTHVYSVAGTYTVKITGVCIGWIFNNTGDKLKLLDVQQWGEEFRLEEVIGGGYFYGCENMQVSASDSLDLTGLDSLILAFTDCDALTTDASIANIDVSTVTSMQSIFALSDNFNVDLSSWDVSNVTNMSNMFNSCTSFNQNLNSWNVGSVSDFEYMFYFCTSFNQNLASWDTSSATTMQSMFQSCSSFNQNISGWNTSNVTNMRYMFQYAYAFEQNLGTWDISNVTDMTYMFRGVTLQTANYDALLIGWGAQSVQSGVVFHGGNSKYTAGGVAEAARTHLISVHGWVITDGGAV